MHMVITGGSRGIGRRAVEHFTEKGYNVTFFYGKSRDLAEELSKKTGATALAVDVSKGAEVAAAFAKIGQVDALICNAGIAHVGLISQISEEEWDDLFAVNVKGIYHCVRGALPSMLARQAGKIVTVSSMWGQVGASCEVAYSATKGAVIAMTKALAQELAPSGITVNCICPGVIETDMVAHLGHETLAELAGETPLGRNGTPQDVVDGMDYLLNASFVTGQILPINGGFVL
ncbi:MAG: SDR family oxidoreductase [Eubacteriales bacterium]